MRFPARARAPGCRDGCDGSTFGVTWMRQRILSRAHNASAKAGTTLATLPRLGAGRMERFLKLAVVGVAALAFLAPFLPHCTCPAPSPPRSRGHDCANTGPWPLLSVDCCPGVAPGLANTAIVRKAFAPTAALATPVPFHRPRPRLASRVRPAAPAAPVSSAPSLILRI